MTLKKMDVGLGGLNATGKSEEVQEQMHMKVLGLEGEHLLSS